MIQIIVAKSLAIEIKKTFSKVQAKKVFDRIYSLEEQPAKGKLLAVVGGIQIKELKYGKYRFYFIVDGKQLKLYSQNNLIDVLLRFIRMSDKKRQQDVIEQIKEALKIIKSDELHHH
jgi:hypothetical protein